MGERPDRQSADPALSASAVERWRLDANAPSDGTLERVIHTRPGQEWAPHWHEEWSVGAIVSGRCRFVLSGREAEAVAGDVLAMAPRAVHTCALGRESVHGARVVMAYVPPDWLARSGIAVPAGNALAHSPALARAASGIDGIPAARLWLERTLRALRDPAAALPTPPAPDGEVARRVLCALQDAASSEEPGSAQALAHACGMSREHFQRVAGRWLGMSPAAWLRTMRMTRARKQLLAGSSIVQAATACGFADQAHFTRWFRRSFGYTPGALVEARSRADALPARSRP
jgi:AraC-like DNA-binding protein/quercetin dioxygenase-like cupin family protein